MKLKKMLPPWNKKQEVKVLTFKLVKAGELNKRLKFLLKEIDHAETLSKMPQDNRIEQR
jgi:hypothetical protein